jgi:type II secretory pathway component GspD/PulD (secretin)
LRYSTVSLFINPNLCRAAAAAVALLVLSCASHKPLIAPSGTLEAPNRAADNFFEEATALFTAGEYDSAANVLRSIGQDGYAYYRMDEVLYWIGRCRLAGGNPAKAKRAFDTLLDYYPQSRAGFEELEIMMRAAEDSLSRHPELYQESTPGEETGSSPLALGSPNHNSTGGGAYEGQPRVTNVFYEADVRQALADISAQTGVSIVPDAFVNGYVTVEFSNTPLESALDRLLSPLGFTYRKVGDYYLVGAASVDNPSFPLLTQTKVITPDYLSAAEVKNLLPSNYDKYLRMDPGGNTLTIAAPLPIVKKFEEDLASVDLPRRQVMIEALVVQMSDDARRSLGLDWRYIGSEGDKVFRIAKHFPAGFDSNFVAEFFRFKNAFDLRVALRALAATGKAKIRANPRVATIDGHEAEIRIAKEIYFSLVQGSVNFPYFTLEKIPTGITLKITPHVGESCEITTDIWAEVSDVVGVALNELPVTNVRTVDTRISVMNGETIGIGGLVMEREEKETNRIPILGDIPFLGTLFGHTTTVKEESEIVILIIPHILISPAVFETL